MESDMVIEEMFVIENIDDFVPVKVIDAEITASAKRWGISRSVLVRIRKRVRDVAVNQTMAYFRQKGWVFDNKKILVPMSLGAAKRAYEDRLFAGLFYATKAISMLDSMEQENAQH